MRAQDAKRLAFQQRRHGLFIGVEELSEVLLPIQFAKTCSIDPKSKRITKRRKG
jgi:hypothetical protein